MLPVSMFDCFYLQNLVSVNMHGIANHVSMVYSMLAYTIYVIIKVKIAT